MAVNYLFTFLAGVFSGLSLPNLYIIPLLIFGYYIFLSFLEKTSRLGVGFFLGLSFGLGYSLVAFHWVYFAISFDLEYKKFAFILTFLFALFFSIFFALSSLALIWYKKKYRKNSYYFVDTFLISLLFFSFEVLRSKIFGGFPWNLSAHIWAFEKSFMSSASFLGVNGLSFITIFWTILVCKFLISRKIKFSIISFFILPLILLLFDSKNDKVISDHEIKVRVIQPNITQQNKWDRDYLEEHITKILNLSIKNKTDNEPPNIVVWPETAVPFYIEKNTNFLEFLSDRFSPKTYIITGGLRSEVSLNEKFIYNSLFLIKDGKIVSSYDKMRLVPFGEFIPLRKFLPFKKITKGNTDFSSGKKMFPFTIIDKFKPIKIIPNICYEGIFPIKINDNNFNFIVNSTNDAWFGDTTGPAQHLVASRFRAIEMGLPLIRSANTGISVIADSDGSILAEIKLNTMGYIEKNIKIKNKETFFSNFGKYLIFIILIFFLMASILIDYFFYKK